MPLEHFNRITNDPNIMGGKPCIRGMRLTVGRVLSQIGAGETIEELLVDYPYLEPSARTAIICPTPAGELPLVSVTVTSATFLPSEAFCTANEITSNITSLAIYWKKES